MIVNLGIIRKKISRKLWSSVIFQSRQWALHCVTCEEAGVIFVAAMAWIADAGGSGGERAIEAALGGRSTWRLPPEQRVQFVGDASGGGQRGPVSSCPPAPPYSRPPLRIVSRRSPKRYCNRIVNKPNKTNNWNVLKIIKINNITIKQLNKYEKLNCAINK